MQTRPITVLIADDHPLLRQGLASIIEGEPDMQVAGEAGSGRAALEACRALRPDVVLMDIQMPELDGIEATALVKREFPDVHVVVLTTYAGDVHAQRALKAGASGYMLKDQARKDLPDVIRAVHGGAKRVAPAVAVAMACHLHEDGLTAREVQVLELAAKGKTNRLIGTQLGIAESTVAVHMKSVLAKLAASDRTHAVVLAIERGIIDLPRRAR